MFTFYTLCLSSSLKRHILDGKSFIIISKEKIACCNMLYCSFSGPNSKLTLTLKQWFS